MILCLRYIYSDVTSTGTVLYGYSYTVLVCIRNISHDFGLVLIDPQSCLSRFRLHDAKHDPYIRYVIEEYHH